MKDGIKGEVLGTLAYRIIEDILKIAAAGAVSYIGADFTSKTISFLQEYRWPLAVLFFVALTFLMEFVIGRFKRNRPSFRKIESDFHVVERNIYYEYLSKSTMIYRRRYVLRALRNGLSTYSDRFSWTGEGPMEITSAIPDHEVHLTSKKNVWQFFEIRFPRTLNKNETIEAEVVWNLQDPSCKAVPFASVTIHEPTDLVKLEVKLPTSFGVKEVICEHSPDIGARSPYQTITLPVNRSGIAVWTINDPQLLHFYEMRWANHH